MERKEKRKEGGRMKKKGRERRMTTPTKEPTIVYSTHSRSGRHQRDGRTGSLKTCLKQRDRQHAGNHGDTCTELPQCEQQEGREGGWKERVRKGRGGGEGGTEKGAEKWTEEERREKVFDGESEEKERKG